MSTLLTPKEFDEVWAQMAQAILPVIEEAIQRSPLPDITSVNGVEFARAREARWKCLHQAFSEIDEFLQGARLSMFRTMPDWLNYDHDAQQLLAFLRRLVRYKSCDDKALTADIYVPDMKLLRINAPAWFKNQEFVLWLNRKGTATWHTAGKPSEYSDAFFTFCQGEGSDYPTLPDSPGIPEEIWKHLEIMVAEQFGWDAEVLIWVSNLS